MQNPAATPRADREVRVLAVSGCAHDQPRIGTDGLCRSRSAAHDSRKAWLRLVRLEGVPAAAAIILKQEMLAGGGDAALHVAPARANPPQPMSSSLARSTNSGRWPARLRGYHHGLAATGEAILAALRHYTTPPAALRCGSFTLTFGRKRM